MALLNIGIGLNFSNGAVNSLVGDIKRVNSEAVSLGNSFAGVKEKINLLEKMQGFAAVSNVVRNTSSAVKDLFVCVKSSFKDVFDFVGGYASTGDKIAKTSRLVGLSVKDYQAFASAANHAGLSTEEMDSALKKFNVNLGKARGGDSTAVKAFSSILPKNLSEYKSNTEVISALADSYARLNSSEQKAFVSQEIFGRSGLKMSGFLSGGADGIKSLISDFESHGGGFSEDGAKAAEEFDDRLQDMRETIDSIKVSVAQDLFPVFTELFNSVRDFVKENGPELKNDFREIALGTSDLIKSVLPKIPSILKDVLKIVRFIGPGTIAVVSGILSILPAIVQIWIGLKGIAALVGGGLLASIGGVLILFVEMASIVKQFYDNWDMWCSFVNHELTDAVTGFFGSIWDGIKAAASFLYSLFIEPFVNFFAAVPDAVSDLVDGFVVGLKAVKDTVFQLGTDIYDAIVGSVTSAWNSVKGLLGNLPIIGDLFDGGGNVSNTLGSSVGQMVSSTSTTTTSRFVVDFQNMPRGTTVTPPDKGDFDYSRGYMLAGVV